MKINKKNLANLVKSFSLSSIIFCSGCGLTLNELVNSKGPYEGIEYKKPEGSIIFDYEKKVGPLPASKYSPTRPQQYKETIPFRNNNRFK